MLGVLRRAALPVESRAAGEACWAGEAVLRRLAAILAADVAGYSRLMEGDEEGTLARLGSLRHDLIDPTIALKTASGGVPTEFAGAAETAPIVAR
jgi:class 3 adenylate cyclase